MTSYGIKRLRDGEKVTFGSTGLPYGIRLINEDFEVSTNEASLLIPKELIDEIIDIVIKIKN